MSGPPLIREIPKTWGFSLPNSVWEKILIYQALLIKWQRRINLVSSTTLESAWDRHFLDSLQLLRFLPEKRSTPSTLYDFGSGAGFPALVLAIAREDLSVTLVESDSKKCAFLQSVSREVGVKVSIINQRIEFFCERASSPDILTARALAPLSKLLEYADLLDKKGLPSPLMIFPKGKNVSRETAEAAERWHLDFEVFPSLTEKEAGVVVIHSAQKRLG